MSERRRWVAPVLCALVIVVALVAGSGLFSTARPDTAQRIAALEGTIKCPSCEDLSVAVSNAPTAVAVRKEIASLVAQGQSDAEITSILEAQYGSTILLLPPTSGLTVVLWVVPLILLGLAVAGLVVVLVRQRRRRAAP